MLPQAAEKAVATAAPAEANVVKTEHHDASKLLVFSSDSDIDKEFLARYRASHDRRVILEALETFPFPRSNRMNVRQKGDDSPIYGMCLGMTSASYFNSKRTEDNIISKHTVANPKLTQLLCAFARWELPDFRFSSIQVNKNYPAALHVDKNDAGSSKIIALGDYVGGELWISDRGPRGHAVNINGTWCELDGGLPHCVLPFEGKRFSLVYFNRKCFGSSGKGMQAESEMAQYLSALDFALPLQVIKEIPHPTVKERMDTARARFGAYKDYVSKRGGVGRIVLRLRDPDGRKIYVSMRPDEPLAALVNTASEHMRLGEGKAKVCLQLGTLQLLPSDTVDMLRSFGFDAGEHIISIQVCQGMSQSTGRRAEPRLDVLPSSLSSQVDVPEFAEASPRTPTKMSKELKAESVEPSTPVKRRKDLETSDGMLAKRRRDEKEDDTTLASLKEMTLPLQASNGIR